jgi:hypothetical protein
VHDAVEPALEQADHLLAGAALGAVGLAEIAAELPNEHFSDRQRSPLR